MAECASSGSASNTEAEACVFLIRSAVGLRSTSGGDVHTHAQSNVLKGPNSIEMSSATAKKLCGTDISSFFWMSMSVF